MKGISIRRIAFIGFIFFSGCVTVPITGRKQLSFVPSSQLEILSSQSYTQFLGQSKLSTDKEKIEMLRRVGSRIAASVEQFMRDNGMQQRVRDYDWEFNLIDDDKANAFAMAGGKVAVYTGILSVAQDEAGLATVMAHEVAHVIVNHAGERMSQLLLANLGNIALSQALKEKPDKTRQLAMVAYGLGANVGMLLPYSRTHEEEADHIGLILMAKAGYNPESAIRFWQRMLAQEKTRLPEFLSTHPSAENRIISMRRHLPEAMKYYKAK